ncbi:MAG: Fic family protein [Candidatus Omnitrophica bacterium]|nr:Fic family protein [Candidatus Omnitrophota bacterium]
MKPPFDITPKILNLTAEISAMIGRLEGARLKVPLVDLRRQVDASSIHSSCVIEGNRLTLDQATDVINGRRVVGSPKDILEIKNAHELYDMIQDFDPRKERDLLRAHGILMKGLGVTAGKYRQTGVVVKSQTTVVHTAPSYQQVPGLLSRLFEFINQAKDLHPLIASSIFHYEFEFIHPFEDGNGRMGRFWQTLMLRHSRACFNLVPIETAIKDHQQAYYEAIESANKSGKSTPFIEFMLEVILEAVLGLEKLVSGRAKPTDRIAFMMKHCPKEFGRKEYIEIVGDIAGHTASRDLKEAVAQGLLEMKGSRARAVYKKIARKE